MGVVWAVKHFHPYLYGYKCRVVTDHEAPKSLLNTPHPSGKLACWGLAIQELDPQILYCRGTKNQNADALSCSPVPRPGVESGGEVAAKDGDGAVNALTQDKNLEQNKMVIQTYKLLSTIYNCQTMSKELENWYYLDHSLR